MLTDVCSMLSMAAQSTTEKARAGKKRNGSLYILHVNSGADVLVHGTTKLRNAKSDVHVHLRTQRSKSHAIRFDPGAAVLNSFCTCANSPTHTVSTFRCSSCSLASLSCLESAMLLVSRLISM